jgi:hypothetical protein
LYLYIHTNEYIKIKHKNSILLISEVLSISACASRSDENKNEKKFDLVKPKEKSNINILNSNLYNDLFLNTKAIKCHITSKMKEDAIQKKLTLSKLMHYKIF